MYILTFDRAPECDLETRPLMAYGTRIHNNCPRRAHFDAGQFVNVFDDENARECFCLYKVGCKGPDTFSPCPIVKWNGGVSFPIQSGASVHRLHGAVFLRPHDSLLQDAAQCERLRRGGLRQRDRRRGRSRRGHGHRRPCGGVRHSLQAAAHEGGGERLPARLRGRAGSPDKETEE